MDRYKLMAPCHFGLETVLKREIYDLGYEITKVEDDTVMLKISDDVQLKLSRAAVHINITKQEAAQTDDKKD